MDPVPVLIDRLVNGRLFGAQDKPEGWLKPNSLSAHCPGFPIKTQGQLGDKLVIARPDVFSKNRFAIETLSDRAIDEMVQGVSDPTSPLQLALNQPDCLERNLRHRDKSENQRGIVSQSLTVHRRKAL